MQKEKTKIVYAYYYLTNEYIGHQVAHLCPETQKEYLIPGHTTEIEPPEHKEGFARVFSAGEWIYVEDKRGTSIYDCATGQVAGRIDSLVYAIPEGHTLEVPEEGDIWDDGWKPKPPPSEEELNTLIDLQIQAAYQTEADPLFFKWQRGEGTKKEWTDKVKEIKERYKL